VLHIQNRTHGGEDNISTKKLAALFE